ncbi:MAG: hypothetical protein WC753_00070 [Candidatus Gracilibacteria bacterium]|jgi:hypothetical protein
MASARSYILDTKSVQRNSPLAIAALLTSLTKKHLKESIERGDLADMITSVNFFQGSVITIVTGKPIINFELRMHEGSIKDLLKKTLIQHGFSGEIFINYK